MLILAVETSTPAGSIALVEAPGGGEDPGEREKIIGETILGTAENHSVRLMPALDGLLGGTALTIHQVRGIALGLGPGSFTGLRIAVSTVKGLALALKVPVVGVPTLDVLAYNLRYSSQTVCPVLDARKKEVYAALFRGNGEGHLEKISEDWVLSPEDLCSRIQGKAIFLGNGLEVYGEVFREKLGSRALFAPPELSLPRAANVARLSLSGFKKGLTLDLFSFTPVYLRRSEAEIHREKEEQTRRSQKSRSSSQTRN
jgi:tRNA threonylcarbamoyladenosine biosynthesis protein TsaB